MPRITASHMLRSTMNEANVILTEQPGANSWPITGATFILIHERPNNPVAVGEALKFFAWVYTKGAKMAEDLDYVPLPMNVAVEVENLWTSKIKNASEKPLYVVTP